MGVFLRWYTHHLKKHQFVTNMITTGAVFFLGDILSQQVVERKGEQHEFNRTFRSVVIGSLYTAPAATFVYNLVDKVFGSSQTPLSAVKKMGVLTLFTPFSIIGYVILNNILQSKSFDYIVHQIKSDVPTIVLTGYSISIPTQFVLLTVVPLRHRLLFGNMVRVLWTCYLTHASNTGTQRRIFGSRKREELKD